MNPTNRTGLDTSDCAKSTSKKSYCSPVLYVYGDVRAITSAVGVMGGLDGKNGSGMTNSLP
jgi:hypothetical protein